MKAPIIIITLFASIILSSFYSNAQTELISFDSQVAEIYKGKYRRFRRLYSSTYFYRLQTGNFVQKKENGFEEIKKGSERSLCILHSNKLRRNK